MGTLDLFDFEGARPVERDYRAEREARIDKNSEIERLSRPLHELVKTYVFDVVDVVGYSRSHVVRPHSERVMGGHSSSYSAGMSYSLELKVHSTHDDDEEILPIQTIGFSGFANVSIGNVIEAKIPLFEEVQGVKVDSVNKAPVFYLPRDAKEGEFAIELIVMDGRLDKIGTYRSTVFDLYQEK